MSQAATDPTLLDLVRTAGLVGLLSAASACFFAVIGLISMLVSKKPWHIYILVIGIVLTLALGWLSHWDVVVKANNEIMSAGGQANSADVAKALAVADYGPLFAFYGCVLLSALIGLGRFLDKQRPRRPRFDVNFFAFMCFVFLATGTDQLIALNDGIASGGGVRNFTSQEAEGAGESPEPRLVVESSGQLAEFSGTLQPKFERALLYRGLGKWGLLGVLLFVIFSLRSKRGAAAPDPQP
jgi:hypothetical protein